MKNSLRSLFVAAFISFGMSACQSVGDGRAVPDSALTQERNNAQQLGESVPGTPISLSSQSGKAAQTVTVGDIYTAASGRDCKRLFSLDGQPLNQVICLNKSGEWILQRSLSVKTTSYSVIKDSYSEFEIVQPMIEVQASYITPIEDLPVSKDSEINVEVSDKRTLGTTEILREDTETLWSFSQRVTGNGENWQKLAELNNIENAWKMSEMRLLRVPFSMLATSYASRSAGVEKVKQK